MLFPVVRFALVKGAQSELSGSVFDLEAVDDEVGSEVGVGFDCGWVQRVRCVKLARERRQGDRSGKTVGEQEVEGARRDLAEASFGDEVLEYPVDRREAGWM